jgi:hypothetical protein
MTVTMRIVKGYLTAVRSAAKLAASAGTHLAWWLDYKVGGRPRDDER